MSKTNQERNTIALELLDVRLTKTIIEPYDHKYEKFLKTKKVPEHPVEHNLHIRPDHKYKIITQEKIIPVF